MWWTALIFPVALGLLALAVRRYMPTFGYPPALMFALFGGALLGVAIMTFVYAMVEVCHGNYDIVKDFGACTYHDASSRGM